MITILKWIWAGVFFFSLYMFIFQGWEVAGWDFEKVKTIIVEKAEAKAQQEFDNKKEEIINNATENLQNNLNK